jgi:hypothetical protein
MFWDVRLMDGERGGDVMMDEEVGRSVLLLRCLCFDISFHSNNSLSKPNQPFPTNALNPTNQFITPPPTHHLQHTPYKLLPQIPPPPTSPLSTKPV